MQFLDECNLVQSNCIAGTTLLTNNRLLLRNTNPAQVSQIRTDANANHKTAALSTTPRARGCDATLWPARSEVETNLTVLLVSSASSLMWWLVVLCAGVGCLWTDNRHLASIFLSTTVCSLHAGYEMYCLVVFQRVSTCTYLCICGLSSLEMETITLLSILWCFGTHSNLHIEKKKIERAKCLRIERWYRKGYDGGNYDCDTLPGVDWKIITFILKPAWHKMRTSNCNDKCKLLKNSVKCIFFWKLLQNKSANLITRLKKVSIINSDRSQFWQ